VTPGLLAGLIVLAVLILLAVAIGLWMATSQPEQLDDSQASGNPRVEQRGPVDSPAEGMTVVPNEWDEATVAAVHRATELTQAQVDCWFEWLMHRAFIRDDESEETNS
jgi:hypothetical protein